MYGLRNREWNIEGTTKKLEGNKERERERIEVRKSNNKKKEKIRESVYGKAKEKDGPVVPKKSRKG